MFSFIETERTKIRIYLSEDIDIRGLCENKARIIHSKFTSKFIMKSETNKRKDVLTLENIRFQSKTIGQTRKSTGWMPGH